MRIDENTPLSSLPSKREPISFASLIQFPSIPTQCSNTHQLELAVQKLNQLADFFEAEELNDTP